MHLYPWQQYVFLFLYFTFFTLLFDYIRLLLGTWKLRINWSCSHSKYVQWQQFWNSCTGNKIGLQAIRPTVGGNQPKSSLSRRDVVVVNRLRIGHTRCTHLLTGADQPECTTSQCPLTVKHILVDCFNFNDTGKLQEVFVASSMKELFRTAGVHNILDFTKETHFYSNLWCL